MNPIVSAVLAGAGAVAIAACGSAAAGTTTPKGTPTPGAGRGAPRNGAAGQLVQMSGQKLILSNSSGDTTVTYTSSTPVTQTSTGTVSDIAPGVCMTATGQQDSTGHITASSVTVRNAVNGSCANGLFGGQKNGGTRTTNPSGTPPPQAANLGRAAGLVNAVDGTAVTVQDQSGGTISVTVPTTVRVSKVNTVDSSALQTGECVAAAGSKDSSGVVQARSLTIVPAGRNGCFTGGGGGFSGRGGFPAGGTNP